MSRYAGVIMIERRASEGAEPRVLMAEDESEIALLVREALEEAGFHVTWAADGAIALERDSNGSYDALLTDVRMPNLDGVSLVRAVRERHPDLPVVVLSGYMTALDREALLRMGVSENRMLEKPVPLERVAETLRDALRDGMPN
jgi:two-component system response regulator HydG